MRAGAARLARLIDKRIATSLSSVRRRVAATGRLARVNVTGVRRRLLQHGVASILRNIQLNKLHYNGCLWPQVVELATPCSAQPARTRWVCVCVRVSACVCVCTAGHRAAPRPLYDNKHRNQMRVVWVMQASGINPWLSSHWDYVSTMICDKLYFYVLITFNGLVQWSPEAAKVQNDYISTMNNKQV